MRTQLALPVGLALGLAGAAWLATRSPAGELAGVPAHAAATTAMAPASGPVLDDPIAAPRDDPRVDAVAPPPVRTGPWCAPVRGTLVDEDTGQPIAHMRIELPGPDGLGSVAIDTDEHGSFRSRQQYCESSLRAHLILPPHRVTSTNWEVRFEHTPDTYAGGVPERPVPVGPTYHIDVDLPRGMSLGGLGLTLLRPRGADEGPSVRERIQHDERGVWVRFPPLSRELVAPGPPWVLALYAPDHGLLGDATVTSVRGRYPEPVKLELQRPGSLRVVVHGRGGSVPSGAELDVRAITLDDALQQPLREPLRGEAATLRNLRPDDYEVTVRCDGYYAQTATVHVASGGPLDRAELTFVLDPVVGDGALTATLTSSSGTFHADRTVRIAALTLDDDDASVAERTEPVTWSRVDGRWSGTASFTGLPAGEYELTPARLGVQSWQPERVTARTGTQATFELLDDREEAVDLYLRVVDGRSGALLTEYDYTVAVGVGTRRTMYGRSAKQDVDLGAGTLQGVDPRRPTVTGMPPEAALTWSVSATGYEVTQGTLEAFDSPVEHDGRRVRVAQVALARAE